MAAYAVFPAAVLVERTTLTEGLGSLCLVVALSAVISALLRSAHHLRPPSRTAWTLLALAAALLGLATVKIWGIAPLLVIMVYVWFARDVRAGAVLGLAATAVIFVVCLPFFLAAPAQMWRMVVLDQLGRDHDGVARRVVQLVTLGQEAEGGGFLVVRLFGGRRTSGLFGSQLACSTLSDRGRGSGR